MQQLALALDSQTPNGRTFVRTRRGWPEVGLGLDQPRQSNPRGEMDRAALATLAEEWLTHLRDERRLASSTIRTYRSQAILALRLIPPEFSQADLRSMLDARLGEGLTGHQRYSAFVVLDQFFRWREQQVGLPNPLAAMHRPPKPRSRRVALSPVELEMLAARLGSADLKPKAEIQLMLFQGFRVSDVVNLKVADVDFAAMRIRCRAGKGGRDDWLPMGPTVAGTVRVYLDFYEIRDGWVFPGPKGRMTPQAVWKAWRRVCGPRLSGLCPHQLRHTYATLLLRGQSHADINTVRKLMRHRNLATTQLYLDDDHEVEKDAILSLDSMLHRQGSGA